MSKTANDRDGFTSVKPAGLLDKVKTLKEEGCRFYHMFADESDNGSISYIFLRSKTILRTLKFI